VGVAGGQFVAHAYILPEPEQTGIEAGQTVPHPPQLLTFEMSTSHPSSGFVLQWE
jgi:hypothetical protein